MSSFIVEVYAADMSEADLAAVAARVRAAAKEVSLRGARVRYRRSIFVPQDEICIHMFEGPSAEVVRTASERAGLVVERVLEALAEQGAPESEDVV